ncbi:very-long-chain 3-oxoacyl-CoA reductase 1-like isoform X2 [Durio zibethinus]|uniref:Very-long-chain 3-oxoacyl-CoA reductase 1-like isoform X2 n=1 Tax=Durio zibethinus TaxID=66656 RepID=A0A6P5XG65_DURZI|nr:very-long-chain 3-oxoacyl-CoA reductase 1-like isoform X2 [Durio zibethinus]
MAAELDDFVVILAISTLGFISLCNPILGFIKWVWIMFFRSPKNLKDYGSWAIVTGCTDGIGKALAFQLASKGLHLVLVGRNPSKLEATLNAIHERFGAQVETRNVVIDLAKSSGEEISKTMKDVIRGLDIGVLVNNAGLAYPSARFFHEVDSELMESIIKVNIEGATWITKAVLPVMMKKKKGAIVNVGSGSSGGICSYPLYTIYAATKAYLAMWSRSINLEYKKNGIDIQCQCSIMNALPDALKDQWLFNYFLGMRKRALLKDSEIQSKHDPEYHKSLSWLFDCM